MKLYGSEGVLLMEVEAIEAAGQSIQIKGKMMGQVPMRVVVGPQELREAWKLLTLKVMWRALRLLFRRA
ncbi:hypothetical protein [Novosphingobium sp.]|uniref:hypothetical protein n=1 Tax=Novosphingobium sp. TaxID=1874826 RepID=UPI003BAB7D75